VSSSVVPHLSLGELAARLAIAGGLSAAIGLERELRDRVAGLRTHIMVGLGAAVFTLVSAYAWGDFVFDRSRGTAFDPTRIAAQVVSGIGFLGAGAIIRQGFSVRGLTTAAGLWVVAAIGMASAAGYYSAAAIATGLVLIGLSPLRMLETRLATRTRGWRRLELELDPGRDVTEIFATLDELDSDVADVELADTEDARRVELDIELPGAKARLDALSRLGRLEGVRRVGWRR
jgi:putative Mg2+ transporter-C (MgtC) family protein